jgi:hypothetical protein
MASWQRERDEPGEKRETERVGSSGETHEGFVGICPTFKQEFHCLNMPIFRGDAQRSVPRREGHLWVHIESTGSPVDELGPRQ